MTPLQQRMIEDSQLRGLSERTREASGRALRQLAAHDHTSPAHSTAAARRDSCLSLKHVKPASRRASPMALCGLPFFSEPPLTRAWATLTFVRAPRETTLPVSRSVDEGRTRLAPLQLLRARAGLTTLSSWGRRLQEGTHLHVPDLASARMGGHVRSGTGAKDRDVPLPPRPLECLRQDWTTHRQPPWLCPAPGRGGRGMAPASPPMPRNRVQDACRGARTPSGITTRASGHTLRHRSATPRLDAGVQLRLIQASVGPHTPPTTAISTPRTVKADASARHALTARRRDRCASRAGSPGRVGRHLPASWPRLPRPLRPPEAHQPPGRHAGQGPMPP